MDRPFWDASQTYLAVTGYLLDTTSYRPLMRVRELDYFRLGGLSIALVGFIITRVFVAESMDLEYSVSYFATGFLPLLIGLGLTIFGMVLSIGPFTKEYIIRVSGWCLLGVAAVGIVAGFTVGEQFMGSDGSGILVAEQLLVSNMLLGGAIAGIIIGDRSAKNRVHRIELQRQANRGRLLRRLLRHEVINAATIIDGYAIHAKETGEMAGSEAISEAANRILSTIEEVEDLTDDDQFSDPIDIAAYANESVSEISDAAASFDIQYIGPTSGLEAEVDERVRMVISELLGNAAKHGNTSRIEVALDSTDHHIILSISDDGESIPEAQQRLLEHGQFPEFDDPTAGFGLQMVRLLTIGFNGRIQTGPGLSGGGTRIELMLPAAGSDAHHIPGVPTHNIFNATISGIIAGLAMGIYFSSMTEQLPVIGSLYGVGDPVIGWTTHLFHSVVFALILIAMCDWLITDKRHWGWLILITAGWAGILWLVAAGILMPVWLGLLGFPAELPALTMSGLISHALWGLVMLVSLLTLRRFEIMQGLLIRLRTLNPRDEAISVSMR